MDIPDYPEGNFEWLETLPVETQKRVWQREFDEFQEIVNDHFDGLVREYSSHIRYLEKSIERDLISEYDLEDYVLQEVISNSEDDNHEEVEDWDEYFDELAAEVEAEVKTSVNPYTGEAIMVRGESQDRNPDLIRQISEFIDLIKEICGDRNLMVRYQWNIHVERMVGGFPEDGHKAEWDLVRPLYEGAELESLFDSHHTFYGRDPEDQRERQRYQDLWDEAYAQKSLGNHEPYERLTKPTALALEKVQEGHRVTREMGSCYICKKLVKAGDGELLLWNEIPKAVREEFIPGVYRKWHVRHFVDPCSQEVYGKRIPLTHTKEVTEYRNQKSEPCWMCGVEVAVGEGWLVLVDHIPKWKQQKRAFPGARRKKYYVQCCRG